MATTTVENYVKEIFLAQQQLGDQSVPMGQVARALSVVPGTATVMVKSLSQSGLVDYEPRRGVRVTPQGRSLALRMIRRHRLIELFLVQTLGLDWGEIHAEAERLEHAISDRVLERLDALLGHPKTDPHGDPIPSAEGDLDERVLDSLADCRVGKRYRIARVGDQSPAFLQFLDEHGLKPGTPLRVEAREDVADAVTLQLDDGQAATLGLKAAAKIMVE
jgi:DtxR family Mn-dependent transcriptional regulator